MDEMELKTELLFHILQLEVKQKLNLCVYSVAKKIQELDRSLAVKRLDKSSKPTSAAEKVAKTKSQQRQEPTKKIASKAKETGPGKNQMPPKLHKQAVYTFNEMLSICPPTPVDIQRYNTDL
ncbi:hypothetical protein AVEN_41897-1 [Araneus ventricosus]|uniref:Uncharacterized protein n=1 Tax=Araneus ventricosus TaxID=182803 RepID=A0A4Y2ADY0_ARAVE|nr:hypothetical protein AVEN_41897-1 [Araneus ventricosus]